MSKTTRLLGRLDRARNEAPLSETEAKELLEEDGVDVDVERDRLLVKMAELEDGISVIVGGARRPFAGRVILDKQGRVLPCPDLLTWGFWMEKSPLRIVKVTFVLVRMCMVKVSTVFLGLSYDDNVFETMIFGGVHDNYQRRYATREEALNGHEEMVALA